MQRERASEPGVDAMFIVPGRDTERTGRVMAELWSHATKLNLQPVRWRLGFYCLRDLLQARDANFQMRPYSSVRPAAAWGCQISIVSLSDVVELVAFDDRAPRGKSYTTIAPGDLG